MLRTVDTSFEHYLASRTYSNTTKVTYRGLLARFGDWCAAEGVEPTTATRTDILSFLEMLRSSGLKHATVGLSFRACKGYFHWLEELGTIPQSPMRGLKHSDPPRSGAKTVPLDDLRKMLSVTTEPKSWAIIAILAFNGLVSEEIRECNVSDLEVRDGTTILHISPRRKRQSGADGGNRPLFVVLVPEVAQAVNDQLEGRRTGPLFLNRAGKRMTRSFVSNLIRTATRRAQLDYEVTPQMLTYMLPIVAMQEGFSLVSVTRAMGFLQPRQFYRWTGILGSPLEQNASVRLARLVLDPPDSLDNVLLHAEAVLLETDIPEAFAVMGAGAILERHLRDLCEENGVEVPSQDKNSGSLNRYADELRRIQKLSLADKKLVDHLANLRNDAAHGWFERLPSGSGLTMLRAVRELCARHPLQE